MKPFTPLRKALRGLAPAVLVTALATIIVAGTALADAVTTGQTVNWTGQGANSSGIADSCSDTEWLFVLNGIAAANANDVPQQISVTFTNGTTTTFPLTSLQGNLANGAGNAHYSIAVTAQNGSLGIKSAFFVVPAGMTAYNQFVLSHGGFCGPKSPPPPPPGGTPELDSILLFAAGLTGLGCYVALRRRARRI